ncbi:hypothetical protein [Micromonospora sp. CA-111912]|uniref:hypothetical protein n=1 Tax=Micromonospora sp. CA-111912 TaxID=3239955 RepID=UPI003D8CEC1C
MTATLNDPTGRKKRPEPSAEAKAAADLVRAAKEQGLWPARDSGVVIHGRRVGAVFVISFGLYWLAWVLRGHELWREGRRGEKE